MTATIACRALGKSAPRVHSHYSCSGATQVKLRFEVVDSRASTAAVIKGT